VRLRVVPGGPLRGECRVPGDKSIAHRGLILGAIAQGETRLRNFSTGDDNLRTIAALRKLGCPIERDARLVRVPGGGLDGLAPAGTLDCGNSGTTMRMLCGLLAGQAFDSSLDGDASLRRRPMRRVAEALGRMGASIRGAGAGGEVEPPLEVRGSPLSGAGIELAVASAQVKSAVLVAGLYAAGPTRVREPARSRDHTERMLRAMGAPLSTGDDGWLRLRRDEWTGALGPVSVQLPGDLSSAAFVIGAALVVPSSEVIVQDVGLNPTRTGVLDALIAMGADLHVEATADEGGEPLGLVWAEAPNPRRSQQIPPLRGCRIDGERALRCLDELPLLAAVATAVKGETVIAGAAELRAKESDRIATLCAALGRMGADVEERPDGMLIRGGRQLSGAHFTAAEIALSLAVAALGARGETTIDGAEAIATSWPGFAETLASLGAGLTVDETA
jgi:3-phosphoshikimate 1-carboxyvinyltransferase